MDLKIMKLVPYLIYCSHTSSALLCSAYRGQMCTVLGANTFPYSTPCTFVDFLARLVLNFEKHDARENII